MFALGSPEIVLDAGDDVAGIREQRLAAFHHAGDVVEVSVRQHHHVDLLRLETGRAELRREPAAVRPLDEAAGAVAGVEKNELLAGVDQHRREARLIGLGRQHVVAHQLLDLGRCGVAADDRIGAVDEGV
jgi:hypothetical protein